MISVSPATLKETLAASYGAVVPRSSCAVVTHEENVGTKCICTILIYNVKRVNNVALWIYSSCRRLNQGSYPVQNVSHMAPEY